jgi:CBS domain containing-hemolysin-like protein
MDLLSRFHTIGGFVLRQLGHLPKVGELQKALTYKMQSTTPPLDLSPIRSKTAVNSF